ncbi:MAG: glycosyltransferase, partial [Bacteroidales bacterium]|nr:glycosyltransferase [Bacteroidales bacterium]
IYTVIATKSFFLKSQLNKRHILIGPDVWMNPESNPDFIEDQNLYKAWKEQAAVEGLRLRVGRWNVPGEPVAILVDFKQFLPKQDSILTDFWLRFGVDSISGNWDYKETALFGYVAGKVIESFCRFNMEPSAKVVAQFHEWQTGGGLLYLKTTDLPIATVFTTHATVTGRCLAGNNMPLYDRMDSYNGDECAAQFGVTAMHSLEANAARNADIFTTVSEITAKECARFLSRKVDVVTPNGFDNSFTPSTDEEYSEKFAAGRKKLISVASAMCGEQLPEDSVLLGIGGRYEYRNKGIDVFIEALGQLSAEKREGRPVVAFIMVPGAHNGADKALQAKLSGKDHEGYKTQTSHNLAYPEYDQITRRFRELGLDNAPVSNVKVFFIPSYLNGNDGIFNMEYYDLLIGMDLAVFPSYYEPWGYTPLEALAFRVPTLTTTLAGFGLWVKEHYGKRSHPGITVVDRNDSNYFDVVAAVKARILEIAGLDKTTRLKYRENAREVASIALWENQITYYNKA